MTSKCPACDAGLPMIWHVQSKSYQHEAPGLSAVPCELKTFDPAERVRQKAASRAADQAALDSGQITREELKKQNASFAFPRDRIRLKYPKSEK